MPVRTTLALLLLAIFSVKAEDISGVWKTKMVNPGPGDPRRPINVYEPTFEFKVDGTTLTGMARMSNWPGNAPITDGGVDGNRITFTLIHEMTSTANGVTRHPTFKCTGTVHGTEMELTMVPLNSQGSGYEMKVTKVAP